jgi:hypothetical protein
MSGQKQQEMTRSIQQMDSGLGFGRKFGHFDVHLVGGSSNRAGPTGVSALAIIA